MGLVLLVAYTVLVSQAEMDPNCAGGERANPARQRLPGALPAVLRLLPQRGSAPAAC